MAQAQGQEDALRELVDYYGLSTSYTDGVGVRRTLTSQTLASLLSSMSVSAESAESIARSLHQARQRSWQRLVDDVTVLTKSHRKPSLVVTIPLSMNQVKDVRMSWVITDEHHAAQVGSSCKEDWKISEETIIDDIRYVRVRLPLRASLSLGYYRVSLSVQVGNRSLEGSTFLIVAPSQCYLPRMPSRSVGLSVQLYNVRTSKNWGIGDFRDLEGLMRWSMKDLGVMAVGLSPLHDPTAGVTSPYSPSSRLFYNPLYLNLEAIPEFRSTPSCHRRFQSTRFQKTLQMLRTSRLVQYDRVLELKSEMLECLYRAFIQQHMMRHTARAQKFIRYCAVRGERLEQYCLFQVLTEYFGTVSWRQWPIEYQTPNSQAVRACVRTKENRLRYFQYLQWQCEEQIARLDRLAKRLNLPYRLYHDLPVSVHPDGADAWIFQDELASGITLGAPPDSFNLRGQNWGLRAPVPWQMRRAGYRFLIETLRCNMQYGGMLRIDHALGLFRLFIIPEGHAGEAGTYVKTRVDEVLAILALESVRNKVMIVGEDLGVVTPEIRARLAKAGILSYRLMPFEKTRSGTFRSPKQYPAQAIVSFTTHDLPTFAGYWIGRDIEVKSQANLYPTEKQIEQDWELRMHDRIALIRALVKQKLLPKQAFAQVPLQPPYSFIRATYAYLARSPCRMVIVPLEDVLGEWEAPNLPGAKHDAYPSWKLKLRQSFHQFRRDPRIRSMMNAVHAGRKR